VTGGRATETDGYQGLRAYVGDLHNHCGISYGHGSVEDAYANARLQLDFASVTGHAWWHDMPGDDDLEPLRRYHEEGFARLAGCWGHVQDVTEAVHSDGTFVSFLSFEWHSMMYGDHCVYYKGARGPLLRSGSLEELRVALRSVATAGTPVMVLPHHVGYLRGRRGANWDAFTPELTPLVEVMSMHGCAMSDEGPRPYLHTMGPVDGRSTVCHALDADLRFGVIGSTDHHSAHPGSHGYGRAMVWAPELTREALWSSFHARRTYAVTGDPIVVATAVNGSPMGSEIAVAGSREIEIDVGGLDTVDAVELYRNDTLLHVARSAPTQPEGTFRGVLGISVGWGRLEDTIEWDVLVRLEEGRILAVEPRLHGFDVVAPSSSTPDTFAVSSWRQTAASEVTLHTRTCGNPTVTSDATQGLSLEVECGLAARLVVVANGVEVSSPVVDLLDGSRTGYVGGFVSGAVKLHRAVADRTRRVRLEVNDEGSGRPVDRYSCHVRQRNEQHAWSSPTWVSRT
jgi:hypothetical protein